MTLTVEVEDLLSRKIDETNRIEFMEGWNLNAANQSIYAFTNDFKNTCREFIFATEDVLAKTVVRMAKNMAGAIVSNRVSNQVEWIYCADNLPIGIVQQIDSNQAGTIVGTIAEKQLTILKECTLAKNRESILSAIKLSNQRKNYVEYMLPLIELNWLTMTLPHKPTSPKQQFLTTLKGRIILKFLKLN